MVKLLPLNFLDQEFSKWCRSLPKIGDLQETAAVSRAAARGAAPASQTYGLCGGW